ncbi:MAG: VCBS repeat-containing protein [Kouleothrix sp.]|nr:VCBS repeat-containing protein [Kouleothrix sp.]
MAWGDYDGDGLLDLAVGNLGLPFLDFAASSAPDRVYHNDGPAPNGEPQFRLAWEAPSLDLTFSVAWGDVDGDGKLDLAVGNTTAAAGPIEIPAQNRLYRFQAGTLQLDASWQPDPDSTFSLAWGDYDNDGDLDLAAGNASPPGGAVIGQASKLYQNNQGSLTMQPVWSSAQLDDTYSVAWGDVDGDGDLDLLTGNGGPLLSSESPGQPNRIYRNDAGTLEPQAWWSSPPLASAPPTAQTLAAAWGDVDGDGDLDIAVGQRGLPNQLYRNINGSLTLDESWQPAPNATTALAWGDVDGDGALDLVIGNFDAPNQLYRNQQGTLVLDSTWQPGPTTTNAVAWGDYDGDGDLDLAVGNHGNSNQLYRNEQGSLILDDAWTPAPTTTTSLAWGDIDRDGDLDLIAGNRDAPLQLYRNQDGHLVRDEVWEPLAGHATGVAWGRRRRRRRSRPGGRQLW